PRLGSSTSSPNLLSSLKPCPLPEDMPLPVSNRRAGAAGAAAAEEDDDSAGFDWKGLARPSPTTKQRQQAQHQGEADAVAVASKRIAVITGAASPHAAASGGQSRRSQMGAAAPAAVPEGPIDGTDALGRRVWDKEYYEVKAKEKALSGAESFLDLLPKPREKPKPPPLPPCGYRQQLQQRTFKLDFEREVGRTKMVTLQTPRMQQGGFWCDICECLCKDSQAYLDHINGRNHNRILGMSMRVERVPLARVKAKLQAARRGLTAEAEAADTVKSETSVKLRGTSDKNKTVPSGAPEAEDEFDRVKRRIEELQREQELKRQQKKEKKKKAAAAGAVGSASAPAADGFAVNADAAALAAMGLPVSFTGC
ncbi:uncharacterized protein LOC34618622, partial [Cyclospora cayetanensis]|uniref:Uncharacterized protein LOC34618622 n=1 Tax=Cyclospora cayetanensis TaxID=88456 RepID=A0A6P5WDS0_9EIME